MTIELSFTSFSYIDLTGINYHSKLDWTKGNIFSPEDKEFIEIVNFDLQQYLKRNIFPSRTVLVFPPFNGFRRFLIHKLIEDNFATSELAAFSIGQDISRRIVVCYKGLIREGQSKGPVLSALPQKTKFSMIEKESQSRQKFTPTAAVYRPPAARIAESRQSMDKARPDTKRNRLRRPDQQMYVPRPKRASYGNEQPRNRSRSSSRTSLESDSCEERNKSPSCKIEESRLCVSSETINYLTSEKRNIWPAPMSINLETVHKNDNNIQSCSFSVSVKSTTTKDLPVTENYAEINRLGGNPINNDLTISCSDDPPVTSSVEASSKEALTIPVSVEELKTDTNKLSTKRFDCTSTISECFETEPVNKMLMDCPTNNMGVVQSEKSCIKRDASVSTNSNKHPVNSESEVNTIEKNSVQLPTQDESLSSSESLESSKAVSTDQVSYTKTEAMETISISSSDSRCDRRRNSSEVLTSISDSRGSDSSSDSEHVRRTCRDKSCEKMEIEHSTNSEKKKVTSGGRSNSQDQNLKNRRIFPNRPVSDVLIISDTSSSDGTNNISKECEPKMNVSKQKSKKLSAAKENEPKKSVKKVKQIDPGECDWESLYDDSGECLVPNLMEELTNSVGKVRITSVDSDYRPYQSIEERTNDGECVIEIYDFPAEFKTTDLFNIFAAYRNKNFQIKWVDDTHALGVFPSPLMADEVLACTLPFVKTRPLRLGIAESRNKARNLVLPPLPSMERPKTCTALARRLVSGALGLRLPTSSQEREKEKQVLKEAREKRRLEAKQREAAWDGTITSGSCI